MEANVFLSILAGGICFGLVFGWLLNRGRLARLQVKLKESENINAAQVDELKDARIQAELFSKQYYAESTERTRFETLAKSVPVFEAELREIRGRLGLLVADKAALQRDAQRIPDLEATVVQLRKETYTLTATNARLQTQLSEQATAHSDKIASLVEVRSGIEKELKNMANNALLDNQGTFLQLANEVFSKHKTDAEADLIAREKAVELLVSPLRQTLEVYRQEVTDMEKTRSQSYGAISSELKAVVDAQNAVRIETSKLSNALRSAPKTRGRWGEHTLRNVLELSGLSSYCDYTVEESFARDGSLARPDVVIRLPGDRTIVVDAKTSLSAYLDATDAVDESERERHLHLHAGHIRTHVKQLASKTYWDGLTVTPDFVVMFVPGDNFYVAAVEKDPTLFEFAATQRVVIVTPATLVALAKAVAFGWRQEKVAENVKRVHALGRELYRRMLTMSEHIGRAGDALGKSVQHYNLFIGSLEHSVIPQARRFNELEVEGTAKEIPELKSIDVTPRIPKPITDNSTGG